MKFLAIFSFSVLFQVFAVASHETGESAEQFFVSLPECSLCRPESVKNIYFTPSPGPKIAPILICDPYIKSKGQYISGSKWLREHLEKHRESFALIKAEFISQQDNFFEIKIIDIVLPQTLPEIEEAKKYVLEKFKELYDNSLTGKPLV